jgi:cell division septation protein DedD
VVPPWANGPWLRVENGRVRLDVTNFAGLITLGVAALVVLMAFFIGRMTARPGERPAEKQAAVAAPPTIDEALRRTPNPNVVVRATPTPAPVATPAPTPGATPSPTPAASPFPALPAGKWYVRVAWFSTKEGDAEKVKAYLVGKGYDARVATDPNGTFFVRVGETDKVNADRMKEKIKALMPQMAKDVRPILRYDATDPICQPIVTDK